jgi:dTDP-glucose 4,6-dehydratase/GDP-L-fucose synthase
LERYEDADPVNIGSGMEISVRDLVELIADLTGFRGHIHFDPDRPDGQPRRRLDTTRARERFGWEAHTDFRRGLRQTIEWYLANRATQHARLTPAAV